MVTAFVVLATSACRPWSTSTPVLTSAELQLKDLRHEHEVLARRLDDTEATVTALSTSKDLLARKAIMQRLAVFFTTALSEHVRWEQQGPYPLVDRWAPGGVELTTALRCEHEIILRTAAALEQAASAEEPDVNAFARLAHELTALTRAHLEVEDRAFVPLLDRAARDFEQETQRTAVPPVPR